MNPIPIQSVIKLTLHWMRFIWLGIWSGIFGWAAAASTIALACMPEVAPKVAGLLPNWAPLIVRTNTGLQAASLAILLALAVALIWNAIFSAPMKAWCSVFPLTIEVAEQMRPPDTVQETLQRHQVSVIVKNKSRIQSLRCHVAVAQIIDQDQPLMPWSIWSGTIAPNDECRVDVARWFYNEGRQNDNIYIPNEYTGGYASASLLPIPQTGRDLCLSVSAIGFSDATLWCRMKVEDHRLRIERIDHPNSMTQSTPEQALDMSDG